MPPISREEQQIAFNKIDVYVVEWIMLSYPNLNKHFEVYADALNLTMGGLVTKYNGKNLISYFFKKLNEAQKNYSITKKLCLPSQKL